MRTGTRTCKYCKESIDINLPGYIKLYTSYIHETCYREMLSSQKRNKPSAEEIEERINSMKENIGEDMQYRISREKFEKWVENKYDITFWDRTTCTKLSEIYNGAYRGLNEPISFDDLLTMFKQKEIELDRIAHQKESKGQGFETGKSRFNYDLAVILNKYDAFKKWKEKQQLLEIESRRNTDNIDYQIINRQVKEVVEDELDLSKLVDEIFG